MLQEQGLLLVEDGNHGEYRPRADEFCFGGTAFIRASDMDGGRVLFSSASKINETALARIRKGVGRPGDILFSHKGTVGKLALVPDGCPPFVCSPQTTFWRSLDDSHLDRRYLYCYMQSTEFRNQWSSRKGETDMADYVSLTAQRELRVAVPPIREQRAIAECLSALDDKIELNRRMNETLEAMARSLFKSWFVDFDPVTAKAAGKKPFGMTDDLAALFPSKFVDSDQGPIPKGWRYRPVGEVIESVFDGPHATPPDSDQGVVFLGIKNMTGTGLDFSEIRHISEADWPKWTRRVTPRHGDIVFTYEATLGFFALIPPGLRCCLGRRMALVRPSDGTAHPHFLFHWFVSEPFQETIERGATHGSTVDRVPLLDFPKYPVIWPTIPLVEKFEHRASSIWASIHQRQEESRQLIALRDSLLPKLLSGEIRLRDAGRKIKEVV